MNQEDPPELNHLAPKWFHKVWKALVGYLKRWRVTEGFGILITDAAGGGKKISVSAQAIQAGLASPYGLEVYQSEFIGEGDPPADQARRVKVRFGWVASKVPDGIDAEIVCDNNTTTYIYYTCTTDAGEAGAIVSVTINNNTTGVPTDPGGTPDHAPATTSRGLATVYVADGVIVNILNDGRGSRDVTPVVTDVDCEENTLGYLHTPVSQPDISSAGQQDILDRLTALEEA